VTTKRSYYKPKPPEEHKPRGRKKVTGRFETREELVDAVWGDYKVYDRPVVYIARAYEVSTATVNNILNDYSSMPDRLRGRNLKT
jgi:hypothetical protein